MSSSTTLIAVWAVIIVAFVYFIAIYNRLINLRNRFKNAFAQIDVQLQRRYDLIPNLVDTAKKYMAHEQETLQMVIEARNQAASAESSAAQNPSDPEAMKGLVTAETTLTGSMGRLFALVENYPDLKANQTMQQLMEELTATENKVGFARQSFNDAVMTYNTGREQFPSNILANMFNFKEAVHFEVEDEEAKKAVKVSFD
tara:strand:+ start:55019 stop:55618 length:600 start_codon:yes stop_codon:yes gene_type:complete